MLVKDQASLNVSKTERGHFFSCSSTAVMNVIGCAIHASFETSVFARDIHPDCSNFLLSASNDDGALGDKKPMQIVYFSFYKIGMLNSYFFERRQLFLLLFVST